jgi:hypothetical protein
VAFLLLQSQQGRGLADCLTLAQEAVDGNLADARDDDHWRRGGRWRRYG